MKNSQPLTLPKDSDANFQLSTEHFQKPLPNDTSLSNISLKNSASPIPNLKVETSGKLPLKYIADFFGGLHNRFRSSMPAQSDITNGVANPAANQFKSSKFLSVKADERQIASAPMKYTKALGLVSSVGLSSSVMAAVVDKSTSSINASVTTQSLLQDKTLNYSISPSALATQAPRDLKLAINRTNIDALSELTEKYKKNEAEKEKEEAIMTQIRGDALPLATLEAFADPNHDEIEVPWLIGDLSVQQSRHNHKHSHKPTPQSSSDEQRTPNEQSIPHQSNTAQTSSGDQVNIADRQHFEHTNKGHTQGAVANYSSPTEYLQAYLNQTRLEHTESSQQTSSVKI